MTEALFRVERRAGGVVWLTLDRPEIHNAFDDRLIAELTAELARLGEDDAVRVVVLTGAGRSFSAGADLNWMRRTATYGEAENLADARALARLMQTLERAAEADRCAGERRGARRRHRPGCLLRHRGGERAGGVRHDRGAPRADPLGDRTLRARGGGAAPGEATDAHGRADQRGRGGAPRSGPRGGRGRSARRRGRARRGRAAEGRAGMR